MNERLKELRKSLKFTQQEFADRLNIKRGAVANYEIGRNEPIDAVVSLICKEFHVNEEWLRTGNGEMFSDIEENDLVAKAAVILGEKDPIFESLIESYSKLTPANRELLLDFFEDFSKNLAKRKE